MIEIIKAIIYGIVEGVTEWLPVSSTGHLILLDEFLSLNIAPELAARYPDFATEYWSMFEVVIQLGAILAVVVMFFGKLNPWASGKGVEGRNRTFVLWLKVALASVPAAFAGIVLDKLIEIVTGKDIDGWIYNAYVVSAALIIYGIAFILIEHLHKVSHDCCEDVDSISFLQAFLIGIFQMLAIVPGTSRSGSTILGARIIGISRPAAAEFSFFMGIPAMLGASLIKGYGFVDHVIENDISVPALAWIVLLVASAVAFGVSMAAIKFLMDFVKRHSFAPFGIYRIVLGTVVLAYFVIRNFV